jgi:hypothetical protein
MPSRSAKAHATDCAQLLPALKKPIALSALSMMPPAAEE